VTPPPGQHGPGRPHRVQPGQLGELAAQLERDARQRMPVVQSTLRNFDPAPGPRPPGPGEPERGYSYSRTYRARASRRRRIALRLYVAAVVVSLAAIPLAWLLNTAAFVAVQGVALALAVVAVTLTTGGRRA